MGDYYAGEDLVDVLVETLGSHCRVTHLPSIHTRKVRVPGRMARRWQRWCDQEDLIQSEMRYAPDALNEGKQ